MNHRIIVCLVLAVAPSMSGVAEAVVVVVPGTANPWLAGMPDGSDAHWADIAPTYSPVQVSPIRLIPGGYVEISGVTGAVNNCPWGPGFGADGNPADIQAHAYGGQFAKSDIVAPLNSLIGVFLGDGVPVGAAPPGLDFQTEQARDYKVIYPLLRQTFFVGDGLTTTGIQQRVFIPAGATKLFIGTMDGFQWSSNWGSFTFDVAVKSAPASGCRIQGHVGYDDSGQPGDVAGIPIYVYQEGVAQPVWKGASMADGRYEVDAFLNNYNPKGPQKFYVEAKWEDQVIRVKRKTNPWLTFLV